MVSIFINRENELNILNKNWNSSKAEFVVISGRRRIGKTRLVEHFLEDKKGIFHNAKESTVQTQITDLQKDIASYFNDSFLKTNIITKWDSLFDYLIKIIPENKRFYFFIDEFSYLIKNDPSILSTLQKIWDKKLSKTKIFFIVCGSIIGMMQEHVLAYTSPLYGRRTRDIFLEAMDIKNSFKFLKNYKQIDKLQCYGIIGGVPSYLLVAREYNDFSDFIKKEFFNKQGFFYREPFYILSQEFKEIKTYFSILNAIALGKNSATEIANFVGLETRKIFPYLTNLIYLNFIKKEIPLAIKTKYGKYYLKDKMLQFWFNFVDKNRTLIEKEQYILKKNEFNSYFGNVFEEIIRELLNSIELPFTILKIGRWWRKDKEIDIVALNEKDKKILFCECKWQNKVNPEKILEELKEKSKLVDWYSDKRKEYFAVFAKSFKKKIKKENVYLFDLKDLEKLLRK